MCTNEVAVNSVPTHKLSLAHGAQPEPANSQYLYSTIVEQKETGFHDSKAVFLNIKVCGYKYIEFQPNLDPDTGLCLSIVKNN